ncbi:MAG: hypothetical protein U0L20_01530 [Ruminococcus sp.]|nr:hypothetical protein [Ruminococcus sp.]
MNEENIKKTKNKKIILLIILIAILVGLFVVFGMSMYSTPESREQKIISYLEKKYDSKFEIVEMTKTGEHIILNELSCDGSTFCPEIKDSGVHYYLYNVVSKSDNITFEVEYLDRRFIDEITETTTYFSITHTDEIVLDINDYITDIFGEKNLHKEVSEKSIGVRIYEDFDKIYNSDYRQKLDKISAYVTKKNSLDKDLDIIVTFAYSDGILLNFISGNPIVTKRSDEYFEGSEGQDITSGQYIKVYCDLEEYFESQKK